MLVESATGVVDKRRAEAWESYHHGQFRYLTLRSLWLRSSVPSTSWSGRPPLSTAQFIVTLRDASCYETRSKKPFRRCSLRRIHRGPSSVSIKTDPHSRRLPWLHDVRREDPYTRPPMRYLQGKVGFPRCFREPQHCIGNTSQYLNLSARDERHFIVSRIKRTRPCKGMAKESSFHCPDSRTIRPITFTSQNFL